MYLQNVVAKLGSEQPSMYALALAEHVLDGRGAVRIHGGGFGGTIRPSCRSIWSTPSLPR